MSGEVRTTSSTGGQKGVKLERYDLIPVGPLQALAHHFGRGAKKYDDHQWRRGYEWSKSYSAMMRHLTAFWAGENWDNCHEDGDGCLLEFEGRTWEPEEGMEPGMTCFNHTGSHHLTAVAWHAFILQEFRVTHPDHDDRVIVPEFREEPFKIDYNEVAYNVETFRYSEEELPNMETHEVWAASLTDAYEAKHMGHFEEWMAQIAAENARELHIYFFKERQSEQ